MYDKKYVEEMIKLRSQIKPDIVILPSRNDIHQDHSTVTSEGIRAFKKLFNSWL
jgi:LmbE family N-acetylglucosaminyl deacetylase